MTQRSVPSLTPASIQKTQRMKLQANFSPYFSSTSFTAWVFISFHHIKINVTFDIYCVCFFPPNSVFQERKRNDVCFCAVGWNSEVSPFYLTDHANCETDSKMWLVGVQRLICLSAQVCQVYDVLIDTKWISKEQSRLWWKVHLLKHHFYSTTTTSKTHLKSSWLLRHFNL